MSLQRRPSPAGQIAKCDKKIDQNDLDGAIANARSLLEAVLIAIEREHNNPTAAA